VGPGGRALVAFCQFCLRAGHGAALPARPGGAGRAPGRGPQPAGQPVGVCAAGIHLALQLATGLVADDEIANVGPLNRFVSGATASSATGWHKEWGQWLLLALVALHIAAIVFYRLRHRQEPGAAHDHRRQAPARRHAGQRRRPAAALLALAGAGGGVRGRSGVAGAVLAARLKAALEATPEIVLVVPDSRRCWPPCVCCCANTPTRWAWTCVSRTSRPNWPACPVNTPSRRGLAAGAGGRPARRLRRPAPAARRGLPQRLRDEAPVRAPRHRRFGLGRVLAQRLMDLATQAGYSHMLLDTLDDMEAARGLYVTLGFEEIPPYYFNPIPARITSRPNSTPLAHAGSAAGASSAGRQRRRLAASSGLAAPGRKNDSRRPSSPHPRTQSRRVAPGPVPRPGRRHCRAVAGRPARVAQHRSPPTWPARARRAASRWCPIRAAWATGASSGRGRTTPPLPNFDDNPHSAHGVAWQRAWTVVSSSATEAELAYTHSPTRIGPLPLR
jgi:hypothetical protein